MAIGKSHFTIMSVGRNCANFVQAWHRSIVDQEHDNWHCVVILDPSNDKSIPLVQSAIGGDHRFTLFINKNRHGCLRNTHRCTKEVQDPESILVCVDLDDSLYHNRVLSVINDIYQDKDVWMTYGSYIDNNGNRGWSKEIKDRVWANNSHRQSTWSASHLRTFKKWLWDMIDPTDFLMPDGSWIIRATDRAFMYPMLEMCGKKHVRYIKDILYKYNIYGQQTAENKTEMSSLKYILSKKPYKQIERH
ncbi:MAG: glycosyltransferase [Candidatus Lokiarchaeota archaeon]|nr:glycosyltransferase [Candidatus Lokiarchaeota archaeon]